jgi:tetratricopeptide (TPR) repeat protein
MVQPNGTAAAVGFAMCLLVTVPRPLHAQERGGGDKPQTTTQVEAREQALDLFEASKEHYRRGEFVQAATLLRRAYALFPEPVLLYNLARALESNGDGEPAIDAYDEYLKQAAADAEHRAAAEQRSVALRRRVLETRRLEQRQAKLERERRDAAAALRRERQARDRAPSRAGEPSMLAGPLPWVFVGVGAAALVAGAGLLAAAHATHSAASDESAQREAASLQDQAEGLQLGSTVVFIVGGAIAAAGVSLVLADYVTDDAPATSVGLAVVLAELRLRGCF